MRCKIIATEAILPCQADGAGNHGLSGEQRLMLALLIDALNAYQKGLLSRQSCMQRLHFDAEQWFLQDDRTKAYAFSFTTVCDALGIDASRLRRRIIDWRDSVLSSASRPKVE
jgi:hypothetical protein